MTVEERVMTNIIIEKRDIAHARTHNKTRSSWDEFSTDVQPLI